MAGLAKKSCLNQQRNTANRLTASTSKKSPKAKYATKKFDTIFSPASAGLFCLGINKKVRAYKKKAPLAVYSKGP